MFLRLSKTQTTLVTETTDLFACQLKSLWRAPLARTKPNHTRDKFGYVILQSAFFSFSSIPLFIFGVFTETWTGIEFVLFPFRSVRRIEIEIMIILSWIWVWIWLIFVFFFFWGFWKVLIRSDFGVSKLFSVSMDHTELTTEQVGDLSLDLLFLLWFT